MRGGLCAGAPFNGRVPASVNDIFVKGILYEPIFRVGIPRDGASWFRFP